MNKILFAAAIVVIFSGCQPEVSRTVVVMGRGKIIVGENKVEVKDGTGYAEEKVNLEGSQPLEWQITTPLEKRTIKIPTEKGVYILNLKTDTIIGSLQLLGGDLSSNHTITQEELKIKIDSLTALTKGENVQVGGRNYFILPGQFIKVSSNIHAKIFGPFTLIPSTMDAEEGAPEIYKFYTNTEMRQLIEKFIKMTK